MLHCSTIVFLHSRTFFFRVIFQLAIPQSIFLFFLVLPFVSANDAVSRQLQPDHVDARSTVVRSELNWHTVRVVVFTTLGFSQVKSEPKDNLEYLDKRYHI